MKLTTALAAAAMVAATATTGADAVKLATLDTYASGTCGQGTKYSTPLAPDNVCTPVAAGLAYKFNCGGNSVQQFTSTSCSGSAQSTPLTCAQALGIAVGYSCADYADANVIRIDTSSGACGSGGAVTSTSYMVINTCIPGLALGSAPTYSYKYTKSGSTLSVAFYSTQPDCTGASQSGSINLNGLSACEASGNSAMTYTVLGSSGVVAKASAGLAALVGVVAAMTL